MARARSQRLADHQPCLHPAIEVLDARHAGGDGEVPVDIAIHVAEFVRRPPDVSAGTLDGPPAAAVHRGPGCSDRADVSARPPSGGCDDRRALSDQDEVPGGTRGDEPQAHEVADRPGVLPDALSGPRRKVLAAGHRDERSPVVERVRQRGARQHALRVVDAPADCVRLAGDDRVPDGSGDSDAQPRIGLERHVDGDGVARHAALAVGHRQRVSASGAAILGHLHRREAGVVQHPPGLVGPGVGEPVHVGIRTLTAQEDAVVVVVRRAIGSGEGDWWPVRGRRPVQGDHAGGRDQVGAAVSVEIGRVQLVMVVLIRVPSDRSIHTPAAWSRARKSSARPVPRSRRRERPRGCPRNAAPDRSRRRPSDCRSPRRGCRRP